MDRPASTGSGVGADDAELLHAYAERADRDAMGELFSRHADAAFRLALRCSNNAADAEDAVQAAFMTVLRCAAQYRAESSVRVWIMGFVVHACKDKAKAEKTRDGYEARAAGLTTPSRAPDASDKELQDAALTAVNSLPRHYRLPVWLHYLEGLSFKDAGRVLALPENTVRSQANRGIEHVREALASAGFATSAVVIPALLTSSALPTAPA